LVINAAFYLPRALIYPQKTAYTKSPVIAMHIIQNIAPDTYYNSGFVMNMLITYF